MIPIDPLTDGPGHGCSVVIDRKSTQAELLPGRWFLLFVGVLLTVYTLAPFEFVVSRGEVERRLPELFQFEAGEDLLHVIAHSAAFFVFGALFASVNEEAIRRRGFSRFMLCSALWCLALESLQLFLPMRHPRIPDLVCNLSGVWIGAVTSWNWFHAGAFRFSVLDWRWRRPMHGPLIILLIGATLWIGAALFPIARLQNMNWGRNYHLLIGNEYDESEPWLGRIGFVGIYDRALTSEEVMRSYKERSRDESGVLLGYDFRQGSSDPISSGRLRSGRLSIQVPPDCEWIPREGLLLKEPVLLSSRSPVPELTEAVLKTGAFSVAAWIEPLRDVLKGPARIVSYSDGVLSRNFMLGREDSDLVFRVRNGIMEENGARFALRAHRGVQSALQYVVAVYDHGVCSLFTNGRRLSPVLDLREPTVYLGLGSNALGHAAGAILVTLAIALPLYSMLSVVRVAWLRHAMVISLTFLISGLPYVLTCVLVGGPWRPGLLLWLAAMPLAAYPIALSYVRAYERPDSH